jgi:hypothetical protein
VRVPVAAILLPCACRSSGCAHSGSATGESSQRLLEVGRELGRRSHGSVRQRPHHDEVTGAKVTDPKGTNRTNPTCHLVPHHRSAHRLAHDQSDSGRVGSVRPPHDMKHQGGAGGATASPHRGCEVSTAAHAVIRRKHRGQAARRARPLRRREDRIDRPARVRMRRRNPWVLARRRLLGWNVRFDTKDSGISPGFSTGRGDLGQCSNAVVSSCCGTTGGAVYAGMGTAPTGQTQPPTVQRQCRGRSNRAAWDRRCCAGRRGNRTASQTLHRGWWRHAAPRSLRWPRSCGQPLDAMCPSR